MSRIKPDANCASFSPTFACVQEGRKESKQASQQARKEGRKEEAQIDREAERTGQGRTGTRLGKGKKERREKKGLGFREREGKGTVQRSKGPTKVQRSNGEDHENEDTKKRELLFLPLPLAFSRSWSRLKSVLHSSSHKLCRPCRCQALLVLPGSLVLL